jgi:sec-independent protein translocase protein TatA
MFNALEPWHLLIIVGVLVVLFGAKRLPGAARSIGQSMRTFRSEMAQGKADNEQPATAPAPVAAPAALASTATPANATTQPHAASPVTAG